MFVLTFSPLSEKVNTIMVLIHQPVKKSTLGKIVKNCRSSQAMVNVHDFFYNMVLDFLKLWSLIEEEEANQR